MPMTTLRTFVIVSLVLGLCSPVRAAEQSQPAERKPAESKPIPPAYLWTGTGMFVGGMAVGLYAFIHNKNGSFPGQDEYYATNRTLGAIGLLTAFGGGAVLLLGKHRANRAPEITFGPSGVKVTKKISW